MTHTFTFLLVLGLLGMAQSVGPNGVPTGKDKKEKTMTFEGTLKHPVYAIGGETTGTVVETKKDGVFELDLGKNKTLLKQIDSLKGKEVKVTGILRVVKGLEIPERRLVTVQAVAEVKK